MEQQYVFWKTGHGCATALLTFPLAFVLTAGAFLLLHGYPWLQLLAVILLCWPLIRLPFRIDKRRLQLRASDSNVGSP